jgi:hypothetical protein
MLPINGNPFGPGGYFGILKINDTKPKRSISGMMNMMNIKNGSSLKLSMIGNIRSESIWFFVVDVVVNLDG